MVGAAVFDFCASDRFVAAAGELKSLLDYGKVNREMRYETQMLGESKEQDSVIICLCHSPQIRR